MMRLNNVHIFIYVFSDTTLCSVSDVLLPLGGACQFQNLFLGGTVTLNTKQAEQNHSIPIGTALLETV